ncbi:hypothetical protein BEP19_12830 [Ammoniphilus oxalaticus]|uniref:NAD-dependent epimerase/dehydratase domain-containing protein n=1 Tax=Ammoniphilus oxalaticus TaxID=66863 RepID=A0A419SH53_9BACL|nr:NAD-dependent epimerase/dehydratase family protein [Ammoniphilus oxalaticus]RKD23103.1 hypothetical protein BEP19_12830 [Ammoniphilus oxalaticus]
MKRILITGKNSYVGTNFQRWLENEPDKYMVESISVRDDAWKEKDFSKYDVVLHVAAMVHKKEQPEMERLYFEVNKELPLQIAIKAKKSGVKQFIFMSTMAVYGEEGKVDREVIITRGTLPNPKTFYGKSKLRAEYELKKISDESFKIAILRPPIIYGPNCPGNYSRLESLAKKVPIFPLIDNKRSMLHIKSLCKMLDELIEGKKEGLFLPQDDEYVNTSLLVKDLGKQRGRKIYLSRFVGWLIRLVGKNNNLVKKVFGNLVYERY